MLWAEQRCADFVGVCPALSFCQSIWFIVSVSSFRIVWSGLTISTMELAWLMQLSLVGNTELSEIARSWNAATRTCSQVKELLEATEKYEAITVVENTDADPLKSKLSRSDRQRYPAPEELFFYFTGHVVSLKRIFSFARPISIRIGPMRQGLSTTELHTLLKLADAALGRKSNRTPAIPVPCW